MAVEDQDDIVVRLGDGSANGDQPDPEPGTVWIDGQGYTYDDMTFAEQADFENWIRTDLAPPVPCKPCRGEGVIRFESHVELCPRCSGEGEINEARDRDYVVAMIAIIKRRTEPQFTIEDAKQVRPRELQKPRPT